MTHQICKPPKPRLTAKEHPADRAVVHGRCARELLPREQQEEFDAVLAAFAHYSAGNDEAAIESLRRIGLSSPFLEWKLLVRGLIAFVVGDDGRALENWSRLDADRLPACLAAPLRTVIDPAYLATQPPALQRKLRRAADDLLGGELHALRALQPLLAMPERLPEALAKIHAFLPVLQEQSPDLVAGLARCCYSAAVSGHPDGARLLRRTFDPLPRDPNWARLQAFAAERRREWDSANRHWEKYEQVVAAGGLFADCGCARVLIWLRCAENVACAPPTVRRRMRSAEDYFRRALQLDRQCADALRGLFDLYQKSGREREAVFVGRSLLTLAPDDAATAAELAHLCCGENDWDSAVDCWKAANKAAPFDADIRVQLIECLTNRARCRAIAGDPTGADADLDEAERLGGRSDLGRVSLRAAMAYAHGDVERGDALAEKAQAIDPQAAAYTLAAEAARLKLPKPIRTRFDEGLKSAWAQPWSPASAIVLVEALCNCERAPAYYGSKGQLAKARAVIESTSIWIKSANDGERLCAALDQLDWTKPLLKIARDLESKFPKEPAFPFYQACAHDLGNSHRGVMRILHRLQCAQRLTEALPHGDPRRAHWLKEIAAMRETVQEELSYNPAVVELFEALHG